MGRSRLALLLALLSGCGFGYRKTTLSTSVNLSEGGPRDVATLERADYEVLDAAQGQASGQTWYLLWFPVGVQKSKTDLFEDAYFKATDTDADCDALLLPHATTKTVVVPLLLINMINRQLTLRGRCIHVLEDERRHAPAPAPAPAPTPAPQ